MVGRSLRPPSHAKFFARNSIKRQNHYRQLRRMEVMMSYNMPTFLNQSFRSAPIAVAPQSQLFVFKHQRDKVPVAITAEQIEDGFYVLGMGRGGNTWQAYSVRGCKKHFHKGALYKITTEKQHTAIATGEALVLTDCNVLDSVTGEKILCRFDLLYDGHNQLLWDSSRRRYRVIYETRAVREATRLRSALRIHAPLEALEKNGVFRLTKVYYEIHDALANVSLVQSKFSTEAVFGVSNVRHGNFASLRSLKDLYEQNHPLPSQFDSWIKPEPQKWNCPTECGVMSDMYCHMDKIVSIEQVAFNGWTVEIFVPRIFNYSANGVLVFKLL